MQLQIKYLIVLNKTANGNKVSKQWPQIKQILDRKRINYTVTETKYPHHAKLITKLYLKKINSNSSSLTKNILFAIGGDGTIHDVINAIQEWMTKHVNFKPVPLTFLPLGADNNFAKANNIPLNIETMLNQIFNCHKAKLINIGTYYEKIKNQKGYFINNLGISFDAEIVNQENQFNRKKHKKFHFKKLNLFKSLMVILYNAQSFPVNINVDGNDYFYEHTLMLNIANNSYFNGFNLIKHANIHDHKLSLIVVERKNIFMFILIIFMIAIGHYSKFKSVHRFNNKNIKINVPSLEYGQADGEEMGSRFFDINFSVTKYPFWF